MIPGFVPRERGAGTQRVESSERSGNRMMARRVTEGVTTIRMGRVNAYLLEVRRA
jgi:hypothetical protein